MNWISDRCPDRCGHKRNKGTSAQERNRRILRASTVCHLCGEPGADGVDHVIPWSRSHDERLSNLRPAHHDVPNSQGVRCNREKANKDYAPSVLRRSGSLA
jgi:5-methylcytosine-specific restriction endonuclease McrA